MSELRDRQQQLMAYLLQGEGDIAGYVVGDEQEKETEKGKRGYKKKKKKKKKKSNLR